MSFHHFTQAVSALFALNSLSLFFSLYIYRSSLKPKAFIKKILSSVALSFLFSSNSYHGFWAQHVPWGRRKGRSWKKQKQEQQEDKCEGSKEATPERFGCGSVRKVEDSRVLEEDEWRVFWSTTCNYPPWSSSSTTTTTFSAPPFTKPRLSVSVPSTSCDQWKQHYWWGLDSS